MILQKDQLYSRFAAKYCSEEEVITIYEKLKKKTGKVPKYILALLPPDYERTEEARQVRNTSAKDENEPEYISLGREGEVVAEEGESSVLGSPNYIPDGHYSMDEFVEAGEYCLKDEDEK